MILVPPKFSTIINAARNLGVLTGNNYMALHADKLFFLLSFCLLVMSESLIPKTLSHLVWAVFETLVQQKRGRE